MPGITLEKRSPLMELMPIVAIAGPSHNKGKSREQAEMEEGAVKKVQPPSLTITKYEGVC
jgi:hypothetical protein